MPQSADLSSVGYLLACLPHFAKIALEDVSRWAACPQVAQFPKTVAIQQIKKVKSWSLLNFPLEDVSMSAACPQFAKIADALADWPDMLPKEGFFKFQIVSSTASPGKIKCK